MTRDGKPVADASAANAVVGVWSSTDAHGDQGQAPARRRAHEVQVSRLGNPLVNEVVIPLGKKDFFNATQPSNDLKNFGKYVLSPELAKVINVLYPGLNVPETDRTDIVQALLTGIPGLTEIAPKAPPTDTLKINLGTPPNPTPNRFGVLAGDTQGFPNGRRLADDVTDIAAARRRRLPQGQQAAPRAMASIRTTSRSGTRSRTSRRRTPGSTRS